ncbi:hypothetical protein T4C_12960, partial [Trichinella pseudospiralis]
MSGKKLLSQTISLFLIRCVQQKTLKWLGNATRPIPIITELHH